MIGILGSVVFIATYFRLLTPSNFARKSTPEIQEHHVIGKKATLEFIAPGLEEISFALRLDAFYNVQPAQEIDVFRKFRDTGKILPFLMGGKYIGDYVITDLSESHRAIDGFGGTLVAEIQITIREVAGWKPRSIKSILQGVSTTSILQETLL